MKFFAERENLNIEQVRRKVAHALVAFLEVELRIVKEKGSTSCVNCNRHTLEDFAEELELSTKDFVV